MAEPSIKSSKSTTVSSFEEALQAIDSYSRYSTYSTLAYRGHGDAKWAVKPSIQRQDPDVSEYEAEMIRELISLFPNEFINDVSMFDRLVRLQHYGLPTRLLDVTKNPLVALFFAVAENEHLDTDGAVLIFIAPEERCKFYDSDVVSCMANLANLSLDERQSLVDTKASTIAEFRELKASDRLVQFIKAEKPYFRPNIKKIDLFKPVIVTAKRANQRMAAQSGSFILYGLPAGNAPDYKKSIRVEKIVIPARKKKEMRRRLESIGMEASLLFPEIDKATGRIVEIYKGKAVPF
ncbi:MAG: FRG domain-containing protein [Pseudomonadota bacterium]